MPQFFLCVHTQKNVVSRLVKKNDVLVFSPQYYYYSRRVSQKSREKKKKSPKKKSHKVVFVSSCLGVRRINKPPRKTEVATGEEEESRRRCGSTRTRTTYSRDESRAQSYWKINFRIERVTDFKYNNEFPFESGIIRARTGRLIRQTQSTLIHQ